MAAMIQQNPVALRATSPSPQQQQQKSGQKSKDNNNINNNSNSSKNDDVDIANYLSSKLRLEQNQKDAWTYPQSMAPMATPPADWPQGHTQSVANNNPYYYYPQQQQHHYDNKHQRSNTPHRPSPRPRTPSNNANVTYHPPIQIQKSSSTPIPSSNNYNRSSMLLKQQQQQHYAQGRREKHKKQQQQQQQQKQSTYPPQERPPSLSSTASSVPSPAPSLEDSGRRSSVTSVSSGTFSIRSEMSISTKVSLSKRLRKVFSMSHLRSKDNLSMYSANNGSNTSLATVQESGGPDPSPSPSPSTPPSRRRSFASLSGLFQKHAATEPPSSAGSGTAAGARMSPSSSGDLRKMAKNQRNDRSSRPVLRVDTTPEEATKRNIRGRSPSSTAPDSPSSTRSSTVRPTQQHAPRFMGNTSDSLPSPTPSSSSTSSNRMPVDDGSSDMAPPRSIGLHYGLPLHGSPRLRPTAASSTSSLNTMTNTSSTPDQSRRLQFCPTIQVHETFTASEYDRRCDTNATCQKLTPLLAMKIKQELNEFKLTDMEVHVDSRQYTHFFL